MFKKRMKGRASAIALAALSIVCCVSLIVGATLAIFSARKDSNISFTSGELKIDADLTFGDAWSRDEHYAIEDEKRVDFTEQGPNSYAEITTDEETKAEQVALNGIMPGDGVSLNLAVSNVGNVNAKYIVRFTGEIPEDIEVRLGDTVCMPNEKGDIVIQAWTDLAAGNEISITDIEIEFTYKEDVQLSVNGSFALSVEAIQSNADIPEGDEEIKVPENGVIVSGISGGTKGMTFAEAKNAYLMDAENDSVVTISLPAGTYNVQELLGNEGYEINNAANVIIQGAGVGETVIVGNAQGGNSGQAAMFIGYANNITVRNLTVDARESAGNKNVSAIKITTGRNPGQTGAECISTNVTLENLRLIGNGSGHGIDIFGAENVTINNVSVENYGKAGIAYRVVDGLSVKNVQFSTNVKTASYADITDNYGSQDGDNIPVNVTIGEGIAFSERTYKIMGHSYIDGKMNVPAVSDEYILLPVDVFGYVWHFKEASIVAESESGNSYAYGNFEEAIAAVNALGAEEGTVTLTLRENASVTNNEVAKITRDNVILDGAGYVLDLNKTACSSNGALLISGNNVTVRNIEIVSESDIGTVAGIKVTRIGESASNKVQNVVLENVSINRIGAGHAVDLNGVSNAVVSGLTLENYAKTGIAVSNANGVEIGNTVFMVKSGAWGDIGLMSDGNRNVQIGSGNEFGMNILYSEDAGLNADMNESAIAQVISGYEAYGYQVFARDKGGIIIGNLVATVGDKEYASVVEAIENSAGETVKLQGDIEIDSATFPLNTVATARSAGISTNVDLNGHTMTVNVEKTTVLANVGDSLTITNGVLNVYFPKTDGTAAVFNPQAGTKLVLDGVNYTTNGASLMPNGDAASVEVYNSTITAPVFGIGTNASETKNYNVKIIVKDSVVKVTDADSTGVYINVPGTLSIENSTIEGGRQAVMVRGGEATITGSKLINNGTFADQDKYLDSNWASGNEVPSYALVVGNRSSSAYQYTASCVLTDTTIIADNDKYVYLYGNEGEEIGVTFSDNAESLHDVVYAGGWINDEYCVASQEALKTALANEISEIVISESFAFTETINVNYAATISAKEDVVLLANTTIYSFILSNGATLSGLTIDATAINEVGGSAVNIVLMNGAVTMENCYIYGDYKDGDGGVSRAFEVSGAVDSEAETVIRGNVFEGLRQPGYINAASVTVENNTVRNTRGFVAVEDSQVDFKGNVFEEWNAAGISIIDNKVDVSEEDFYYKDIEQISAENDGCLVDDQIHGQKAENGALIVEG